MYTYRIYLLTFEERLFEMSLNPTTNKGEPAYRASSWERSHRGC